MVGGRLFYRDNEEWIAIAQEIKLKPCLHCKVTGMLILHGSSHGTDESGRIVLRARRVFCSNRSARTGCGRTFSVWLTDHIKGLKVTTSRLWRFVMKAVAGPIEAAIRDLNSRLSDRTWQRIWARFIKAQSTIRTHLANRFPPPQQPLEPSRRPAALVLAHLQHAFPNAACPIAAFQQAFRSFFM